MLRSTRLPKHALKLRSLPVIPTLRYKSSTNSGILGTNRNSYINATSTSLCVTDPYLIYNALVANKAIDLDPCQLALIKKLRVLSGELKEYKPDLTTVKINRLVRELEMKHNQQNQDARGVLFGYTIGWFKERENEKLRTQLVKALNDYEELTSDAMNGIPKGLLINGEVGCGKTMLMDIFADSLPVEGKWRIHWSVFIQWVMKEIESISSRKRDNFMQANHPLLNFENEFVLFEVAARMIEKCHVLILDEFMLPDIASAKIVNILFVYYFKLGGVLVASSNRLPEELYSGSINKKAMGAFEQVLRARCDVWDMQSSKDYRTDLKEDDIATADDKWIVINDNGLDPDTQWKALISKFIDEENCERNVSTFTSYGRDVIIPKLYKNIAYFDFSDIIKDSAYGPGDFISIATKYPTIIIDNVPVLSIKMKNHARRLITFIDAIYDSKCNLVIRVETEPHKLFFPDVREDLTPTKFQCTPLEDGPNPICMSEASKVKSFAAVTSPSNAEEVQDLEMFAKTEMDMSNPYRPNFASYADNNKNYKLDNNEHDLKKNFTDMKKFTGEDEMFAYKRAVSRINEMTQSLRWRNSMWIQLHDSIKQWEKPAQRRERNEIPITRSTENDHCSADRTPTQNEYAPQFKKYNFWSMGEWKNKKDKLSDEIAKKWIEGAK